MRHRGGTRRFNSSVQFWTTMIGVGVSTGWIITKRFPSGDTS